MQDESYNLWNKYDGNKIPSSLHLYDVVFEYLKKDDAIIDIGSGFGKISFDLYKKGYANIQGIDINQSGIDFAL